MATKVKSNHKKGKKKKNRPPTPRQEKAAKLMAENVLSEKPKSKRAILAEAGYSVPRTKQPGRVIQAEGFQTALEKHLPDDFLLKNHNDLISQRDHIPSAVKALDLSYEVKGRKTEKGSGSFSQFLQVINVQAGVSKDSDKGEGTSTPDEVVDV